MATRSFIGIYDGNAQTAEYVYCHNDGYIDGVGADLINYYNDERTIRALLKKGDLSSLHPEIDTCVFSQLYEASTKIDGVKTINEAFYEMHQPSIEYMYLYDLGSKKWYYVAGTPSKRVKGKVLPQMESSESFASLKDAIAYLNGVLDRHNGSLDVTSKHIYMQDGVWGNSYEITIIEKDGSDIGMIHTICGIRLQKNSKKEWKSKVSMSISGLTIWALWKLPKLKKVRPVSYTPKLIRMVDSCRSSL